MPISLNSVTKIVELDIDDLKGKLKTRAKDEAGRIIIDEINNYLDGSTSPVSGGRFKAFKKDGKPSQLFQEGDLRSAIVFKRREGNAIEVGVFSKDEAPIAYNHNEGDTLPQRRFIPSEEEDFKRGIMRRVESAIDEIRKEKESKTIGSILEAIEGIELESL